jgi:hypothetical protein
MRILGVTAAPSPHSTRDSFRSLLVKNTRIELKGGANVPVFLVAKRLPTCSDWDVNDMYPLVTEGRIDSVVFENLSVVGNNAALCTENNKVCNHTASQGLQARFESYTGPRNFAFTPPADELYPCWASTVVSDLATCQKKCAGCPVDSQLLSELDQNHDPWALLCGPTASSCDPDAAQAACSLRSSIMLSLFKSSAIQCVNAVVSVINCAVSHGSSAGVGAVRWCDIKASHSYFTQNRWDGLGPDQLRSLEVDQIFTENNGGAGIELSKGTPAPNNDIKVTNSDLDDGMYVNHYDNVKVCWCKLGPLTIGDDLNSEAPAVLFQECHFQSWLKSFALVTVDTAPQSKPASGLYKLPASPKQVAITATSGGPSAPEGCD